MNDKWKCFLRTALPALGLLAILTGCAAMGYSLGTMLPPGIKTVFIPSVLNTSMEPQIESEVTRAVVEEIQRDGSLKTASADQADSVLEIVVTDYDIVPVAYQADRLTAAEEYRIFLTAAFKLTSAKGDVVVEPTTVSGDATFQFAGDLTSSKQQGLPLAARDLARRIVDGLVEYW